MKKGQQFEIADLTNPRVLTACGLKRKGNAIVTDDGDEEHIRDYTKDELKHLGLEK